MFFCGCGCFLVKRHLPAFNDPGSALNLDDTSPSYGKATVGGKMQVDHDLKVQRLFSALKCMKMTFNENKTVSSNSEVPFFMYYFRH